MTRIRFQEFFNRDQELYLLKKSFLARVITSTRNNYAYLIQGRLGVGKTRLITEFINNIESDKQIHHKIPNFNLNKYVIEYTCQEKNKEPYQAFIEITKQIEREKRKWSILKRIGMLFLSVVQIYDVIDAFEKLGTEINDGMSEKITRRKETKIFNTYIKLLKKKSAKAPLILFVQNSQWLDDYSLKLLQTVIDDQTSFWGLVILEEEDVGALNPKIKTICQRLIVDNKMQRFSLNAMNTGFETSLLEKIFGIGFFTVKEYEYIYVHSEGCPGKLENLINNWIALEWIKRVNTNWEKIEGFEEKIKPPLQKMLDEIITYYQDGIISKREKERINHRRKELGLPEEVVESMLKMIQNSKDLGYDIEERLHSGAVGKDAFLAHDENRISFVIEYISNTSQSKQELVSRQVNHPNILPSKEIVVSNDSIFIINDFYEGKNLKEIHEELNESRIKNVVLMAQQIVEGLAALHKNNYVHGFIRPESIIKRDDGTIQVAAIDALQLPLPEPTDDREYIKYAAYFSPEQISRSELTPASDIFSFGILFYQLLTGNLPFTAQSKTELQNAIKFKPFEPFEVINLPYSKNIQAILKKCMEKEQRKRYRDGAELLSDLMEIKIEPFSNTNQEETHILPPQNPKHKVDRISKFPVLVILLICLIAGFILYRSWFARDNNIINDTVIIDSFQVQNEFGQNTPFPSEALEYLLKDDILQSSSLNVLTKKELSFLHGIDASPELQLNGSIIVQEVGFTINVDILDNGESVWRRKYKIVEPSELLNDIISNITENVLHFAGIKGVKKSSFTDDWDAFIQFYNGEIAWEKIEVTKAKQYYSAALNIDPTFVLAKLRMASILRFEGSNTEAKQLVLDIKDSLNLLSTVDSLKAEALLARLEGDIREEIKILKLILSHYPTRKESPFEVAEAYYQICDIHNAINYYQRALHLDKNFAKAINHLAYCYTHLGKHTNAIKLFKKYVQLDGTANSFDSMGDGYLSAGYADSAEYAKREGIKLDPNLNYLYWGLVYINIRQGRISEAFKNANLYKKYSYGDFSKSRYNYFQALIHFQVGNYDSSLAYCKKAIELFDSIDPVVRNHELHWLMARVFFKLEQVDNAITEIQMMDRIVHKYNYNATNYSMGIYKYLEHLKAILASTQGDIESLIRISDEFNGPIKDKIKDHGNPFDLAFFNTSFGNMFLSKKIDKTSLAEKSFLRALEYNPSYVPANYYLSRLYKNLGYEAKANNFFDKVVNRWKTADSEFKTYYGLSDSN